MSLESQQRGLFIVVSRKRERSPRSRSEESLLLAPTTPPATERKRIFDDEEEEEKDWGVTAQEWGYNYVSEIQESHKKSCIRPWWTQDDALLLAYQDLNDATPIFAEEPPSHLPFAMPTFDLASEESYNIGTQSHTNSGFFSFSAEDIEDIANVAAAAVTASPSTPRPADHRPVVVKPAPTIEDLKSSHSKDEESSNLPGDRKHHRSHLSGEETCVESAP